MTTIAIPDITAMKRAQPESLRRINVAALADPVRDFTILKPSTREVLAGKWRGGDVEGIGAYFRFLVKQMAVEFR